MKIQKLFLLFSACSISGFAQPNSVDVYEPIKVEKGAFHSNAPGTVTPGAPAQQVFLGRVPFSGSDSLTNSTDPALQQAPIAHSSAILGGGVIQGLGVGFPNSFNVQYAPADTNMAISANHIVQWVNTAYGIYDRGTSKWAGPFPGNTPWAGFGGGCQTNNDGDPIVKYDQSTNRWIFTQFSVSTKPYLQCFAISAPGDPSIIAIRFAFSFGNTAFPDYPKMGVWPSGYFLSFNIFYNGFFFQGPRACAVDSATALAGGSPKMVCFQLSSKTGSLLPSDVDGPTAPPAGSPNYFAAYGSNSLQFWKFTPNWASPSSSTLTGPTTLSVPSFSRACSGGTCIPQPGTSQKLDSLADRLMYRNAYRNLGSSQSLLLNHSVTPGNGAASGIRWYEVRISNGSFSLFQKGTFAPDTDSRWMGSIAMNKDGTVAVGYSVSGASTQPSIRFTGRCSGDPVDTLQPEVTGQQGFGSQLTNLSRWGDYATMVVDPLDDTKFWFTTEYLQTNGTFNWSTAIVPITIGCP